MSAKLVLVRHGQTDWNVEGRYQGQAGPGLNNQGREQAEAAARELTTTRVDAIYTSDLARALETARIIARALGLPLQADARLREIHQGEWQGVLYDDIVAKRGEALTHFREDPFNHPPPGGETMVQLAERVLDALDDIAARHPGARVVVVTHGTPIALARCIATDRPLTRVWDAIPRNAQIVSLCWPPDGIDPRGLLSNQIV